MHGVTHMLLPTGPRLSQASQIFIAAFQQWLEEMHLHTEHVINIVRVGSLPAGSGPNGLRHGRLVPEPLACCSQYTDVSDLHLYNLSAAANMQAPACCIWYGLPSISVHLLTSAGSTVYRSVSAALC